MEIYIRLAYVEIQNALKTSECEQKVVRMICGKECLVIYTRKIERFMAGNFLMLMITLPRMIWMW